jgi:hypothetical protein
MPRSIKEFRENGQLHRLAIVDGQHVVSIRVFDTDGTEFKWVNPKPWRVDAKGKLVAPKQAVKDDYEAENFTPEQVESRRSVGDGVGSLDPQRVALEHERSRLQEMVTILLERTEMIQELAERGLRDAETMNEMERTLDEIQRIAREVNRRVFDEDR